MVAMIQDCVNISCTTDAWTTECDQTSYLDVTGHWVDDQFVRKSALLGLKHLPSSHTGANLATEFLSVLQDWSLQDKVHVVIRDNARNIIKAMRDANIDSIGCMAHTIQFVIHDALLTQRAVNKILSTSQSIVGHMKHSFASEKLIEIQRSLQLPTHHLRLVQDVQTGWNSSYLMLERLLEQ